MVDGGHEKGSEEYTSGVDGRKLANDGFCGFPSPGEVGRLPHSPAFRGHLHPATFRDTGPHVRKVDSLSVFFYDNSVVLCPLFTSGFHRARFGNLDIRQP
jgi:hypothetical protein